MTTISSTGGSTAYTPTASTSAASSTPATDDAYDGSAAVAQAQALAAQALGGDSSGSSLGTLLGLSSDIMDLLQGSSGAGLTAELLGGGGSNPFQAAQTQTAIYGAAQKRAAAAAATDRVSDLVASSNAALNQTNTPAATPTAPTDTTA